MKKIAIFVEGQTEQEFVERLLLEIAGHGNISVQKKKSFGGKYSPRTFIELTTNTADNECTFFALIVDSGGDSRVKSDILEQYDSLSKAGYEGIIGIRDVYPDVKYEDISKLRKGLEYGVKTKPLLVDFILGVMEIESWFLAEFTHFQRIHSALTVALIEAKLGFNPELEDFEKRENPATDLHNCYSLVGLAYRKKKQHVERTVKLIDYANLYFNLKARFNDLNRLIDLMDKFFASPGV